LLEELPTYNDTGTQALGKGRVIYGSDYQQILNTVATPESLPVQYGAQVLRRKHSDGHHYFITMLQNHTINGWVPLATGARSAIICNPLTGDIGKARVRQHDGSTEIYLQLESGQSLIVKTFTAKDINLPEYGVFQKGTPREIVGEWTFRFLDGMPAINNEYHMNGSPVSWTELPDDSATGFAGTGRYSITFNLSDEATDWLLDLGNLCESARVKINGKETGLVWSLPYTLHVGKYLKKGDNLLEIDVTNLPANRIRDYDRRGVEWRIFKEINFVDVGYRMSKYDWWDVMPSGLANSVKLIPLNVLK
jgi:hypothetical protein